MLGRVGLQTRIVAGSVTIVSAVLMILGVVLWRAITSAVSATAYQTSLATLATIVHEVQTGPVERAVPVGIQPLTSQRVQQVLDDKGHILAYSQPRYRDQVVATIQPKPLLGDVHTKEHYELPGVDGSSVLLVATRAEAQDGNPVTIIVTEPMQLDPEALSRLMMIAVAIGVAAIAVLTLVLRSAVRSTLGPIEQMRRDLEAITSSREAGTVSVPGRDDEIGRLGSTINSLLLRLRRSDAQRTAFVSDAGHELRSPLTTIGLSVEMLATDLPPQRRIVVAERALRETARLHDLVEDLLALAKADEARDQTDAEDIDLDDVVLLEVAVARAKGARVIATLEPARIRGVPEQMRRVVRNLVDNAMRHATSQIRVAVRVAGSQAVLTVDNDGPPVGVADRERVFDRFVRLDEARDRDRGGSGLGLAIVRELSTQHGGTARATQAPDGWCRFQVTVPASLDPADGPEAATD